jgi:membrane protease subunit HflC
MNVKTILAVVVLAVVLIVGSMSYFIINEREQGIVVQFGDPKRVVSEPGLNFKLPWQDVVYYDKRVLQVDGQPEQVTAADQKRLVVDAFALYRIVDPLKFKNAAVTVENFEPLMLQALTATLRENIGRVSLVDVVSGERQALMDEIRLDMVTATAQFGVDIIDVRIKRTDLPKENSEAIFRRMQTEREREASEIRAEGEEQSLRIRAEADRTRTVLLSQAKRTSEILRGEGDGEVVRIFADAFGQDVEFFTFYRTMQAYRGALNADDTTMVMSPDGDFLRFLNSFEGLGVGGEADADRAAP